MTERKNGGEGKEQIRDLQTETALLQTENLAFRTEIERLSDLSARLRESEKKFRNFFEDDLTGDFIADGEGVILDCNPAFLEIYGYENKEEIVGNEISLLYPSRDEFELLRERIIRERKIRNLQAERKRKDGEIIVVIVNLSGSFDQDGKLYEIKGYIYDITERARLEKELVRAREKAEESDRLKSAFLANMSHEIRTPMNAIVGFASFLKNRQKSRTEIEGYADIIIHSSNHLLNLISDIIDISKLDASEVKLVRNPADINQVLQNLYFFFKSQTVAREKSHIEIKMHLQEKELYLNTDETRLRQVFINLIGNALKFTSSGYVEFGYRLKDEELVFFVKDTGIGIAAENHRIIFDRFRQEASTTEKLYGGAGLGLSIARACVELLGGRIWLESEVGKGSTFYFTIDFSRAEKALPVKEENPESDLRFKGEHILIAEDDEMNFLYLTEVFKPHHVIISHTRTGRETLNFILSHKHIQLIIMDIQLPEMNGWEITRYIRKLNLQIPVIAQTAYAFDSDREESLHAGCNAFLTKPCRAEDLVNTAYRLLTENRI